MKQLEEQIADLTAEKERLDSNNERLASERHRLASEKERLNTGNITLQESQAKFHSDIEMLSQSKMALEEDNRRLRQRIVDLEEDISSLQRRDQASSTERTTLNATLAELKWRHRELETTKRDAEMRIQRFEQSVKADGATILELEAKVAFLRTLSTLVIIGAAGLAIGMTWLLRPVKRQPTPHLQRAIGLKSRPDAFSQLGCSVEKTWGRMKFGQPWQDSWVGLMRDALASIVEPGTPESRADAASFIVNTWVRFVAQFEPDTNDWHWTRSVVERSIPQSLRVEIDAPPAVGSSLAGVKNGIDEIYGRGNIVQEVLCPGRRVLDPSETVVAQGGAVIRVGE